MVFERPSKADLDSGFPAAARGWENTQGEHSYWVDPSEIKGAVPSEMSGTFIRNGPGVTNVYGAPLAHPIDGDGVVAAVTFVNGRIHIKNRFVDTFSHREEQAAKAMIYNGNMGSRVPGGAENPVKMRDPAHTNAFYWGGKILACYEYGLPHSLDPRTLDTLGPDSLGGALKKIKAFSAHFRQDTLRDVLVGVGFRAGGMGRSSRLAIFEFDRQWNALVNVELNIEGLNYVHDFLVTPDYYVFHMTPFVDVGEGAVKKILSGEKAPGELMSYTTGLPSKMVVVQRYLKTGEPEAERRVVLLETEPCHIYHFQNAVQHGESKITFGATCLPPGFDMEWQHKVFLSNSADAPGVYHDYEIDLAKRTCRRSVSHKVEWISNEFPTANPYRHSVKVDVDRPQEILPPRYVYLMSGQPNKPLPFSNITKYDPHGQRDAVWQSHGIVGEPVFIPRLGEASAFHGDDDDGWLITQFYIPGQHKMSFVILDAKDIAKGPICEIPLRFHLGYSFHGTWCEHVFEHPPPKL